MNIAQPVRKVETGKSRVRSTDLSKPKVDRAVTKAVTWDFNENDYSFDNQYMLLERLQERLNCSPLFLEKHEKVLLQEINKKLRGYKSQDHIKEIFDGEQFITTMQTIEKLIASKLDCFYCKEKVSIIYASVRDSKQWSLERIYNLYGHNRDNVEIACLQCNLRRRTIHYERYLCTKQMATIKKV
jgi:hypothetical protein